MIVERLTQCARRYCDWAESDTHDLKTAYELLLSLRDASERLQSSSNPPDLCAWRERPEDVHYQETRRFGDFPFQCYPASYWPHRPLPLTDDIHQNFAWIHGELRHGLERMGRSDIANVSEFWNHSYMFRWGHHLSAAIWAIEWHMNGEPDVAPNCGPVGLTEMSNASNGPPSMN